MDSSFDLDLAFTMEDHRSTTTTKIGVVNAESLDVLKLEDACDNVFVMPASGICTVCMEGFDSSCKRAPCGHVYHAACLTKWLSFQNTCPACRCKVPNNWKYVPVASESSR
ncbi:hypothetical protein L2E82_02967 [Cichorium intybus]|uniref:Uncharacterized protein n=1 Tax=Cichorium intybus TaxID=13427 RepID=A0ACB9H2R5_CICIN|nr:hypothetical protein L2E82_02967 [Cichorium intybus]